MFAATGDFMCSLRQKEKGFVVNCAASMLWFSSSMPIGWWKYIDSFLGRCFENCTGACTVMHEISTFVQTGRSMLLQLLKVCGNIGWRLRPQLLRAGTSGAR